MVSLNEITTKNNKSNTKTNSVKVAPDFNKIKMFSVSKKNNIPSNYTNEEYEKQVNDLYEKSLNLNEDTTTENVLDDFDVITDDKLIDLFLSDNTDCKGIIVYLKSNTNKINLSISKERSRDIIKCMTYRIREYIKDSNKSTRIIFSQRIDEFIKYINGTKYTKLVDEVEVLLNYLKEFIETYITTKSDANSNLLLELGITRYISNRTNARILQRYLVKAKTEVATKGTMSINTQKRLWSSFTEMFKDLISGLMTKVRDKNKKDLFISILDNVDTSIDTINEEEVIDDER